MGAKGPPKGGGGRKGCRNRVLLGSSPDAAQRSSKRREIRRKGVAAWSRGGRPAAKLPGSDTGRGMIYEELLRSYRASRRRLSRGQAALRRRPEAEAADMEYLRDMKVDVGWVIKELERRLPPQSREPGREQLERLSPRQRHVYLAFCRGVSHRQMARELGTSVSTVQQHLRRAREKLDKLTV